MKITFDVTSMVSIDYAINKIEKYIEKVNRLVTELPKALAEFGAVYAKASYDLSYHNLFLDGTTGPVLVNVRAEPTDNGYDIIANGEKICFVEFGAGVFLNAEGYKGERPPGISEIGDYGDYGLGYNDFWAFTDLEDGKRKVTHGTAASNTLYYTAEEMRRRIEEEARRILADD